MGRSVLSALRPGYDGPERASLRWGFQPTARRPGVAVLVRRPDVRVLGFWAGDWLRTHRGIAAAGAVVLIAALAAAIGPIHVRLTAMTCSSCWTTAGERCMASECTWNTRAAGAR